MTPSPAPRLLDLLQSGEYGDVDPSVCDSATFTPMQARATLETSHAEAEGCFRCSRR